MMTEDLKSKGVRALNQDFSRFDQVRKDQVYYLSEGAGAEAFDDDYQIRTCDLSLFLSGTDEGKREFAAQLGAALEDIGFAVLVNHGVDPQLLADADAAIREFFESISREQRMPYLAERQGSVNQGYFPVTETTIIHPDMVEGWVFCRRAFRLDEDVQYREKEFWPRSGYEEVFRRLIQAEEKLILPVMQSILTYLGCDPHLYDERLTNTNFGFRPNYYPPMADSGESAAGRMLGHEDVDLFTFLPAPEVEGLQVLNRRNMKWIRPSPPPGSIILNTGDYMQRITNDRLPSTTHRVSSPSDPALRDKPRVSFPMAIYVWEDEMLEVLPGLGEPKYRPIKAIEFHTRTTSKYYGDDYAVTTGD